MSDQSTPAAERQPEQTEKKPYVRPELSKQGTVESLTLQVVPPGFSGPTS